MSVRLGPGPVFAYEWLVASRRWQVYAARSLFVTTLLVGMALVWWTSIVGRDFTTLQDLASVSASFCYAIVGIQFALILVAAPAALAGSICVDKGRGTLMHLLVTDLGDAEIVLGKLAARLLTVFSCLACPLPVLALGTLLGGVDPQALTAAWLTALGLALLTSTLALSLSVWARRPYEVLIAVYTFLAVWLLARPVWSFFRPWKEWPAVLDPIELSFTPNLGRGLADPGWFLVLCSAASIGLTTIAVLRVRSVAVRQASRGGERHLIRTKRIRGRVGIRLWRSPSLDANPVLWRECRRNQPSTWIKVVNGVYCAFAAVFTSWALFDVLMHPTTNEELSALISGSLTAIGFLFPAVVVSTALSEERARGSLDVLLATPLSTRVILLGKWLGAYRRTTWLLLAPGLIALASVATNPARWLGIPLLVGLILSYGAALTSLGLALATWIPRQGRVLLLVVTTHVLTSIGAFFIAFLLSSNSDRASGLAVASQFFSVAVITLMMQIPDDDLGGALTEYTAWAAIWIVVYTAVAGLLFLATLATFNRCLGRCPDAARRVDPDAETTVKHEHLSRAAD